jgi:hypothetical protein
MYTQRASFQCDTHSGPGTVGGRSYLGLHYDKATSGPGPGGDARGDISLLGLLK